MCYLFFLDEKHDSQDTDTYGSIGRANLLIYRKNARKFPKTK